MVQDCAILDPAGKVPAYGLGAAFERGCHAVEIGSADLVPRRGALRSPQAGSQAASAIRDPAGDPTS